MAFKQLAVADREKTAPLAARFTALDLPGREVVCNFQSTVEGILEMPADDCVRILSEEGKAYAEARKQTRQLAEAATEKNAAILERARRILREQMPLLVSRGLCDDEMKQQAQTAQNLLLADDALLKVEKIRLAIEPLEQEFRNLYQCLFDKRKKVYNEALQAIMGSTEWMILSQNTSIEESTKESILEPLRTRSEPEMDLPPGASACARTGASLGQLESDIAAVDAISKSIMDRILKLTAPEERIERVPIRKFYPSRITNDEELEAFLGDLRQRLEKILSQKATILLE
jgi:cell division septum initiation protein DivIVA